jgi:twitching motility two-component system response regulator PilH
MGKKILTDAGYDVVTVSNGAAAVKKLPEVSPDIVLLDIYMPGYSGLEVCALMKSDPQTAQIPVLLTVGKLEPFLPEDGMQVKAEGVVIKPFEATDLLAVVSRMAERVPPPAPAPVAPVPIATIAIPDFEDLETAPNPKPETVESEASWADATAPAFGDDLLDAQVAASAPAPTLSSWPQPSEPAPSIAASPFGNFEIELEPLPPAPANHVIEIPLTGFTIPEPPAADSEAGFPVRFELDAPAEDSPMAPPPSSCPEAVVNVVPFTPEVFAPEQVKAGFEAAISTFESTQENPVLPEVPTPRDDARETDLAESSDSADELSRTLQEALAAVTMPEDHHADTSEGGLEPAAIPADSAQPVSEFTAPVAPSPHQAPAWPLQRVPEPVMPEAMGTVLDLDSILGEFSSAEATPAPVAIEEPVPLQAEPQVESVNECPTSLPAVFEEQGVAVSEPPTVAPADFEVVLEEAIPLEQPASQLGTPAKAEVPVAPETEADFCQSLAEQLAERVLQRLKPQLVEEIRNVLKEM